MLLRTDIRNVYELKYLNKGKRLEINLPKPQNFLFSLSILSNIFQKYSTN